MQSRSVWVCIWMLHFITGAAAQSERRDAESRCAVSPRLPECAWLGSLSAESIADVGDEVFRFEERNIYRNIAYEVIRGKSGVVTLHARNRDGGSILYPMNQSVWVHLLDSWKKIEKEEDAFLSKSAQNQAREHDLSNIVVCAGEGGVKVNTVIGGVIAYRTSIPCGPLSGPLYQELARYLMEQVPFCPRSGDDYRIRNACFALEGDRYAASQVVTKLYSLRDFDRCDPAGRENPDELFAPGIEVHFSGERWSGRNAVSKFTEMICGVPRPQMGIHIIEGRSDTVVVTGSISFGVGGTRSFEYFDQPYRQTWALGKWRGYRVVSWDVERPVSLGVDVKE